VIGAVGLIVVLVSTELLASVVLTGVGDAKGISVITEVIVVAGMIAIKKLPATTTSTAAVNHPSEHNIYCVHYGEKIPGKWVLVLATCI